MGFLRICAWEKLTDERIEEEVRCSGSLRNILYQAAVQELFVAKSLKSQRPNLCTTEIYYEEYYLL